jgi:hypothetical protein
MAGFFISPFFTLVVKYVDNPVDKLFHRLIPSIPGRLIDLVKYLQTEAGVIGFNLLYILLFYIFVLILILWVVI